MHSIQFEQFCWWLLQREYDIEDCQLIGGPGRVQEGIDLFGYAKGKDKQLVVFECKCWKEFDGTALRDAVDRFLGRDFATAGTRFVLIIAQQSAGHLSKPWDQAVRRLHARGIVGEMWTGVHLTDKLRSSPDILGRFFPDVTVVAYCNEWMRRVDFHSLLQKALVDDRSTIRKLAHDFLGSAEEAQAAERAQVEQIFVYENHWAITTPWTRIDALYPRKEFYPGSLGIVIKRRNTSGLTITFSQQWILRNLLAFNGAPAERAYRPFIVGPVSHKADAEISVDLQNVRLQLPVDGLVDLCGALDKFGEVYLESLRALERLWEAEDYPFIDRHNTVVALCTVPKWLWKHMLDFACHHCAGDADSPWHVFNYDPHCLKLFTTRPHPDFEHGYHAFVHGRSDLDGLGYDVVLTWDPPGTYGTFELGSRRWLSASETLSWLRDKLIPAVGAWLIERDLKEVRIWRRSAERRRLSREWTENATLTDQRRPGLLKDERYRLVGLVATVRELQANLGFGSPVLYLTPVEMQALNRAMITVIQGGFGYLGYLASNLSIRSDSPSREEIVSELNVRIVANAPAPPDYALRCFLSAMLEGLNDDDTWLPKEVADETFQALMPIMHCHDLQNICKRHSYWL